MSTHAGYCRPMATARRPRSGLHAESRERELHEMKELLGFHGFDPEHAHRLHDEGEGPEELKYRLGFKPGEHTSLEFTHGFKRTGPKSKGPMPEKNIDWRKIPHDAYVEQHGGAFSVRLSDGSLAIANWSSFDAREAQTFLMKRLRASGHVWVRTPR